MDDISESNAMLRLPGSGFSVWVNACANGSCHLPGDGFSVWTNAPLQSTPTRLHSQLVQLPGEGFCVWTHADYATKSEAVSLITAAPNDGIHALGQGFSTWTQTPSSPIIVKQVSAAQAASSASIQAAAVSLPGNGFSVWATTKALTSSATASGVTLPGNSFSIWAKPHRDASAITSQDSPSSPATSTTEHPSILINLMKSLGLVKLVGIILLVALLFAFLGTKQKADSLKNDLTSTTEKLEAKSQESSRYYDEINDLQSLVSDSKQKATALTGQLASLEKAKTGVENSLKTQIANLEIANKQAETARKAVDTKLVKTTKALTDFKTSAKSREEALNGSLKKTQDELSAAKSKETELAQAMNALETTKTELESKLAAGRDELKQARGKLEDFETQVRDSKTAQDALQQKVKDLTKLLESKLEETKEAEGDAENASTQAHKLDQENRRLAQALETSRKKLAAFQATVNTKQKTLLDDHFATAAAVEDDDLRRHLESELKNKRAFAEFVRDLRAKVQELQSELADARSSVES